MDNTVPSRELPGYPWSSSLFWWVWGGLLVAILGLTMAKDLYLTGEQPQLLFYLTVPLVSILGSTLGGWGIARLLQETIGFADMLAVSLITAVLGQVFENAGKLTWHLVWEDPGWLYLLLVLGLGLLVPAYCLICWPRMRWPLALIVALGMFLGELLLVLAFTAVTGISTPGS